MLCLGRRVGEKIRVGDDIVITVLRIGADRVRLGIQAGQGTPIVREELLLKPETEKPCQSSTK